MSKEDFTAFTLAEVLITLGIIGVVAALTFPALMSNYRKQVIETRLAKFYSVINQALKRAEADHESIQYWDTMGVIDMNDDNEEYIRNGNLTPMDWYKKYLDGYIKVLRVEEKANTFNPKLATLYFVDGSAVQFDAGAWLFFPEAKNMDYCYNQPNPVECSGNRYFYFYLKNSGLEAPSRTDTWLVNNSPCTKEVATYGRAMCTTEIMENGWKIPKNYPIKF